MTMLRVIAGEQGDPPVERFECIEIKDPVLRAKLRLACSAAGISPEAFIIDLLHDALGHIRAPRETSPGSVGSAPKSLGSPE